VQPVHNGDENSVFFIMPLRQAPDGE
jgi:hypothetical protein